jgi:ketosteroid isomerase-like protein
MPETGAHAIPSLYEGAQENKQTTQDAYAAFSSGDAEGAMRGIDDSIEWTVRDEAAPAPPVTMSVPSMSNRIAMRTVENVYNFANGE